MTQKLRAAVVQCFTSFSARFEGVVSTLYVDVLGLVTTGIGNLVDPLPGDLQMLHADGSPASGGEVAQEWSVIKHTPGLAQAGARAAARLCKLHLSPDMIAVLVNRRLDANVAFLSRRWPGFWAWPAPAQLAVCSWAWACGAGCKAPMMDAALNRGDFRAAAENIKLREAGNPGLVPRNRANRALMLQAAQVTETSGDPEALTMPWDMPSDDTHHAPLPDHLSEEDQASAEALSIATMQQSTWDLLSADRAARDAASADA